MLIIVTAIHGRHAVAAAMLKHHAAMAVAVADAGEVRIVAAISPSDCGTRVTDAIFAAGAAYCVCENRPVSGKWQAALDFAHRCFPRLRGIMTLGSDDFVTEAYLRRAIKKLKGRRSPGWGPRDMFMFDAVGGLLGHHPGGFSLDGKILPIGAGRVYSASALDAVDWRLWTIPRNNALDTAASARLAECGLGLRPIALDVDADEIVIDVKDSHNIHSWSSLGYDHIFAPGPAENFLRSHGLENIIAARDAIIRSLRRPRRWVDDEPREAVMP